jgi:hypothetical protein
MLAVSTPTPEGVAAMAEIETEGDKGFQAWPDVGAGIICFFIGLVFDAGILVSLVVGVAGGLVSWRLWREPDGPLHSLVRRYRARTRAP